MMIHILDLAGDIEVKEEQESEAARRIYDFGCTIYEETETHIVFEFYGETKRRSHELVEALHDMVVAGTIDILNIDEETYQFGTYVFKDGTYDYTYGIPVIDYGPDYTDRFVEQLPPNVINAVLTKYGNNRVTDKANIVPPSYTGTNNRKSEAKSLFRNLLSKLTTHKVAVNSNR